MIIFPSHKKKQQQQNKSSNYRDKMIEFSQINISKNQNKIHIHVIDPIFNVTPPFPILATTTLRSYFSFLFFS